MSYEGAVVSIALEQILMDELISREILNVHIVIFSDKESSA